LNSHKPPTRGCWRQDHPNVPTYEILFSVDTPENRQGIRYASLDEEGMCMASTHDEIKDVRALVLVLPEHQTSVMTAAGGTMLER